MSLLVRANDHVEPIRVKLTATTATTIVAGVDGQTKKIASPLWIVNTSGGAVNVTVTIVDAAAVVFTRYPLTALAAGAVLALDLESHPIFVDESVKVTASVADTIQVTGSVAATQGR